MKDAAAQVLVCAVEGKTLSTAERQFFSRVAVSGITIFGRNIEQTDQGKVSDLILECQSLRPPGSPPLVIAVDQEGGRVARLKPPFPNQGPAMLLAGGLNDKSALLSIESAGFELGAALKDLRINVNFAPVLDILTEPTNHAIGDRSFGNTVDAVTLRAGAFLNGLQSSGIIGCLKHFPGQGAAKVDTHVGSAVVDLPASVLNNRELSPFRALLKAAPMVMIAHCIYPAFSPKEASRSPEIMQELLRKKLAYEGVIVSDDMTMGAIPQDEKTWQNAIIESIQSGADMLLICRHLERFQLAYETLTQAARRSSTFAERLEDAAQRVLVLRQTLT